ncbi:unnamed protein product [Peronospora destructor]|uniref:Ribophorin II n=1 Tax=Peronospora destructor TaxID=86335 RepID=A0AAV0URB9_9STRA|nr:unnamed protein product [Peronospora destructor]
MTYLLGMITLTADALEVAVMVTPQQPKLKELTLETLVDTSGAVVLSGLTLKGDGSKFVTQLTGDDKLQAGMYKLKVSTADEGTNQDRLSGAATQDKLKMEVTLQQTHDKTPVVAHQAFLRFKHATEKTETYFVLTADAAQTHSTTLQFTSLSKSFGYNSGKHHVELILGASTFEKAIVWDMGNIELQLGAALPEKPSSLYKKPLLYESDMTLKALPEISHVMRTQDPRPPVTVSLAFMGAVLAPLAFFLLFLMRLGFNTKRLFEDSVFVFGCVFLASLGGILALFGLYWLKLTMFRTLGYLSVLGFVNLWSGHLTLKHLAETPAKKTTKVE